MNQEQVMGLIRQALPLAGGIATTLGYASPELVGQLSAKVLDASGLILIIGSGVWSMMSKTKAAIVERAIALPEVQRIETSATAEGKKLAQSVPHPDVVSLVKLAAGKTAKR